MRAPAGGSAGSSDTSGGGAEFREEYLTYAALDERGTKFANHLLALGVMAGSRVAVCLERSLDPIIVFLGILKAGSAYVPLDPDLPPERLTYMLEDCGAAL